MGLFNCVKNRRAQIVLPAILLVPTILLVIYLLFETAKLSRFKIRSQFALDSAAFIELTSYSNFLNAVAYLNGAMPFRVFRENMMNPVLKEPDSEYSGPQSITYYDLFYEAGAFPAMPDINSNPRENAGKWELKYVEAPSESDDDMKEGKGRPKSWNTENPKAKDGQEYGINKKEYVENYRYIYMDQEDHENENPDEDDKGIMDSVSFYISVYKIIEGTYEGQKKTYERLTKDGEFFRKSFYYNSSSCKLSQCGKEGVRALKNYSLGLESLRLKNVDWWYRIENQKDAGYIAFKTGEPKFEKIMPLYQLSYLDRSTRSKMKKMYTGVDIREPVIPPDNYFRVNVKKYAKKLHVRAALQCTNESNNCVWPNPTPKYQVRLFP